MSSHGIHTRRLRVILLSLLLSFAAVFAVAGPAAAHDELIASDPVADSTVDALPERITLTYSAQIYAEAGATQIEVTDAAGASLAAGEPLVDGAQVIQELTGTPTGAVTVVWRVTSSDGHPIDGEFAFTVTEPAAPAETTPATEPTPTAAEATTTEATTTEATITATPDPAADAGSSPFPWIVGGIILLAVGGAVVYVLVARSRRGRSGDQ